MGGMHTHRHTHTLNTFRMDKTFAQGVAVAERHNVSLFVRQAASFTAMAQGTHPPLDHSPPLV